MSTTIKVYELLRKIRNETGYFSSPSQILRNENTIKLIGFGPKAIPFIIQHYKENRGLEHALILGVIVGPHHCPKINPKYAGMVDKIQEMWIKWYEERK